MLFMINLQCMLSCRDLHCFDAKSILLRFTHFCVEQKLTKNLVRGGKMTNIMYGLTHYPQAAPNSICGLSAQRSKSRVSKRCLSLFEKTGPIDRTPCTHGSNRNELEASIFAQFQPPSPSLCAVHPKPAPQLSFAQPSPPLKVNMVPDP